MGRIGQRVAQLLSAFGMTISYFDIQEKGIDEPEYHQARSLDALVANADVLILTASMDRASPVIIGQAEIAHMKPGAVLLNAGRAELVDKAAIYQALKEKQIAGYAVDDYVFSAEEAQTLEHGRLLQTGHTAWYANEAMARGTEMWIQQLIEMIEAEQLNCKAQ
jgi:phosphoglycerate dehydrogenase-like enzyme